MSDAVIQVEKLGKKYIIGHQTRTESYTALRDVISRRLESFVRNAKDMAHGRPIVQGDRFEEIWALRDASFEVCRGEVMGIIGHNGAGKSTLLKVLSRVTEPSEGRVSIAGRVASLLEVGTGFHPELTGRENIFLNGAILGMSRFEIRQRFDEIVAFAGVEKFTDTPVKRYSTGMYVRLAFAVAAHLEPEILIVDEVLAVGDAEFQKKCLGKLRQAGKGGRTVLFVSHNMAALQELCTRALILEDGRVRSVGPVDDLVREYLKGRSSATGEQARGKVRLDEGLYVESITVEPDPVVCGGPLTICLRLRVGEEASIKELAVLIYSAGGTRASILDLRAGDVCNRRLRSGTMEVRVEMASVPLVDGVYELGLYFVGPNEYRNHFGLASFSVAPGSRESGFVPYPASVRGVFEPQFEVRSSYPGADRTGEPA
jgi:lipopolysaccharide transport system ATP-binding protein